MALYKSPEAFQDASVTVCGWARSIRDSKALGFIDLNDGSCFKGIQVVFTAENIENYKEIAAQNVGAALRVTGTFILTPEAKQPFELQATEIVVEGASSPEYPLQKKRHTVEYLRTVAHLRPRTNLFNAAFRVRSAAAFAIHKFFNENGFVYAHTPIITGSDCEGAGEMFQITTLDMENPPRTEDGAVDYSKDFFSKQTSLTVSGQLEAECMAMAFGKVYTFGPTFRAERSFTPRHAGEFWMVEPEIAFADLNDDMDLMESMIKYIIRDVLERCPQDIDFFNQFVDKGLKARLEHVANSDFVRISYTDAVALLEKNNDAFEYKVSWGCDLQTEHERYLTEKQFGSSLRSRSLSPTTRRRSRRSTCASTTTARPSRRPTCLCRASASSAARARERSGTTCCSTASGSSASRRRTTGGTSTCAASAATSTRASASALSAW